MARILVAEDEADIRQIVCHVLVEAGHEVAIAKDGDSACEAVLVEPPDLLILDVMMPGKDGYTVLQVLESCGVRQKLKILVLTARAAEQDWERSFELGAHIHMPKPFDPDELVVRVDELLGMSADELASLREEERSRAHLLSQLDSLFGE